MLNSSNKYDINLYCHGLVVIPCAIACRVNHLFELFETKSSMRQLSVVTSADERILDSVVRMFTCLNWFRVGSTTLLEETRRQVDKLDVSLLELLDFNYKDYVNNKDQLSLQKWLRFTKVVDLPPLFKLFIEGLILVPLLYTLDEHFANLSSLAEATPNPALLEINDWFYEMNWSSSRNILTLSQQFLTFMDEARPKSNL